MEVVSAAEPVVEEPVVPPHEQVFGHEGLVARIFRKADTAAVLRGQAVNSLHSRVLRKCITEITAGPSAVAKAYEPIPGWMSHLGSFPYLATLRLDGQSHEGK